MCNVICLRWSFLAMTQAHNHLYMFIALSLIHCSKSAQKFAVWVCQVTTVITETMQLVISQFYPINWESNNTSHYQKQLVNVVNWWSYVILIAMVRFFLRQCSGGLHYQTYTTTRGFWDLKRYKEAAN